MKAEAPPFNFQGMLRKTNHQRASMKRSKSEYNDNNALLPDGNIVYRSNEHVNGKSTLSPRANFDFDENDNPPPVAPRKRENAPVPSERNIAFGESISLESIGTYVQEEIHPGVMLEGYAVEL